MNVKNNKNKRYKFRMRINIRVILITITKFIYFLANPKIITKTWGRKQSNLYKSTFQKTKA